MAGQLSDFWNQVGTTDADIEHAYGFLLERGTPASSRELAAHLVEWRVQEEERRLKEIAERRAPIYQPKNTYAVDQSVLFTALGNQEGVVKEVRPGDNPRLGNFEVIRVKFDDEPGIREFAAGYAAPHPLNEDITQTAVKLGLSPEEAIALHGETVRAALVQRMSTDREFVHLGDQWFLKGLLPEINPGYLNLAEAAIEQAGDALSTGELQKILDMPETERKTAARFALALALANDSRFEDVGPVGESRWFLTHLEPIEARERPGILDSIPFRSGYLPPELESLANEIAETADWPGDGLRPSSTPRDEVTLVLTYPHRRAGTLPLTPLVRAMLPNFAHPRLRFNFIDATSQDKFAGYAVADGSYLAGLTNWIASRRLSPGAYVTIRRGPKPLNLIIDYQPQRERSLWVRVARATNGLLTFSQEKRPLAHKYDEEMLIVVADPVGLDNLAQTSNELRSLPNLLERVFPELAKLSGAGRVHAKTLFSAVNLIRRINPRMVLNALAETRSFQSVGGGYFVLNEEARH